MGFETGTATGMICAEDDNDPIGGAVVWLRQELLDGTPDPYGRVEFVGQPSNAGGWFVKYTYYKPQPHEKKARLIIGMDADGFQREVNPLKNNGATYLMARAVPGTSSSGLQEAGSPVVTSSSDPAASSWGANNIDVFFRGTNKALWHIWWDGQEWRGIEDLGGVIPTWERPGLPAAPPAAAVGRVTNRVDVFALGTDRGVYTKRWDGQQWSDWHDLGGVVTSGPAVSSWGPNNIDVFARGQDKALWHLWWDGTKWSHWEELGGVLTSGPAAVGRRHNWVDVFYRGQNNHLWTRWWDGQKSSDEVDLGGVLTSAPAVSSWAPNNIDVFARGQDKALWHLWWDGEKWSEWEDLGGVLTSQPTAVARQTNYVDVFARGQDKTLYTKWWDGQSWSDWVRVAVP